jgi:hypothetical protein
MSDDVKKASRRFEKRAFTRFTVPGASLSWMPNGQDSFSESDIPLADISRGGLAFLSNNPPTVGSSLFIKIFLPQGKETIELLGRVIYSIPYNPGLIYRYRVGVQVKALLDTNASQSMNVIKEYEDKYAKPKED